MLRKLAGKTQAQLAYGVNLSAQQISNYETGKCNIPYSRWIEIEAYLSRFVPRGLSEAQTPYLAPEYNMKNVESDLESLLAKVKILNRSRTVSRSDPGSFRSD